MPPNSIYVGRPSQWGNPYPTKGKEKWDLESRLRLYDAYGTMPLGEYIRLCMDEKGIA